MEDLLPFIKDLSWPTAIVLSLVILYRGGVFKWITSFGSDNGRIERLEGFQAEAEGNHFTDLERVMNDVAGLQKSFNDYQLRTENRLTRIETKLNGTLKAQD